MEVSKYNQMMAYLTRPRERFRNGGNVDLSRGTPSITDNEKFQNKVKKLRSDKKTIGQIADELKVSVATVERTIKKVGDSGKRTKDVVAQEKLKKAYNSFVKNTGEIPRIQDMRNAGLSQEAIARAQREGIEFGRRGSGKGSAKAKVVNDDLIAMSKNNKIKKALADGIIPNVQDVIKVTSATDEASALNRLVQLSDEILSNRKGLNLKLDKYKSSAKLIFDNADVLNSQIREIAEREIGASVEEQSIKNPRKDIVRQNIMQGYNIDEPAGVMSSYRRGSKPYGIFSQAIGADLNQRDKLSFDAFKSIKEKEIQMAKGNERLKKINEFNQGVTKYEKLLNADRKPGELKVKLFRASMKDPSKTVARFSQLPKEYQTAFIDNYNKLGYSFEVPKDIKTIFEMREDIKKPAVLTKVKERVKTGQPRVLSSFGIPDPEALSAFGKAGQVAKAAVKAEAAIAPLFLAGGAMYGLPFSRNINEATYGLLGDSKNEFLIKKNPDAKIVLDILEEEQKYKNLLENYNKSTPATQLQFKDKMIKKQNEFQKKLEAFKALPESEQMKSAEAVGKVTQEYEDLIKQNRESRFQYGVIPKKQLFIDIADTFKNMGPSKPVENVFGAPIPTGQIQTEFAGGGIAKLAGVDHQDPHQNQGLHHKAWIFY
jgi:DNA-binding Lrp family transcriptional regulator